MRYLITLILFVPLFAFGQRISGHIYLEKTSKPITDALVIIDNSKHYALTNVNGYFELNQLSSGQHQLHISALGFKDQIINITAEQSEELTVYLVESLYDIPGVEVSATSSTGGLLGSLDRIPSSHYISTRELSQINSQDINKILFNVPGVNIQEEDGFGLRPNIGLRGSGSDRSSKITLMEDEILSAPAPYAAPSAYYFPTSARMSGIEIEKGSSQIKYGPYTTGGIINLLSTPIPDDFAGNLRLNGGNFGTKNLLANVGGRVKSFSALLQTFQNGSDGFKKLPIGNNNTGFYKQDYLAKVKWEHQSKNEVYQSVQYKTSYTKEDSDETYLGLTSEDYHNDPLNRYAGSQLDEMKASYYQNVLTYQLNYKKVTGQVSYYRNRFKRNWYKLASVEDLNDNSVSLSKLLTTPNEYGSQYDFVKGANNSGDKAVLNVKANNRAYLSTGIQGKVIAQLPKQLGEQLVVGLRYHQDDMDRFQWTDGYAINNQIMNKVHSGTPGSSGNRIDFAKALSSYVQYEAKLKEFSIKPGLRYEHIELGRDNYKDDYDRLLTPEQRRNTINVWLPGVEVNYFGLDNQQLYASVHKGFAPPGSRPETNPESSTNYELGYRFESNLTYLSAVGFYVDYSNLLGVDNASAGGNGSGDLYNGGAAHAAGVELSGQHHFILNNKWSLPLSLAYTFTDAQFDNSFESEFEGWSSEVNTGDYLPYIAKNQLNVTAGLSSSKANIRLRGNYMSAMRTIPSQGALTADNHIANRFLLNVDANYLLKKRIKLLATVNNVFNKTYVVSHRPSGLRPGLPRAFNLGVDWSF